MMDLTAALKALRLTCLRCGHAWTRKTAKRPDVCPNPKCKSPYWDRARKVKR